MSKKSSSKSLVDLLGPEIVSKEGSVSTESICGSNKVVGLYFSAHWCPPCRKFTPVLAEFYNKFKSTEKKDDFEIVFVSSDRETKQFDEYFQEMPWKALPFDDRDRKVSYTLHLTPVICAFWTTIIVYFKH